VLIALADRCKPDGRSAWPTVETLMAEAHCSKSTVKRSLRELEESGAIRRGNQHLAEYDEHGRQLQEQYRPIVWECCMGVTAERVAQKPGAKARAERDGRDAMNQRGQNDTSEEPQNSNDSQRGQNEPSGSGAESSGVTGEPSGGATSDPSYIETNIITNKPPIGPPRGTLPENGKTSGGDAESLCAGMVALMRRSPRLPVPLQLDDGHSNVSERERKAAVRLVEAYGLQRCLAVVRWALRPEANTGRPGGFSWRSVVTGPRKLLQKWDKIVAQMANDPTGVSMLAPLEKTPIDQHRAIPVSSEHRVRIPVYGASKFGTPAAQGHLEGRVPVDGCPLCIFDGRNHATHGDPTTLHSPAPSTPQPKQETPLDPKTGRPLSMFKDSRNYVGDAWMREHTQASDGADGGDRDE
jgi:hypothetical protein